jgi:hypothetical protein
MLKLVVKSPRVIVKNASKTAVASDNNHARFSCNRQLKGDIDEDGVVITLGAVECGDRVLVYTVT